jgi:hypothetical protein
MSTERVLRPWIIIVGCLGGLSAYEADLRADDVVPSGRVTSQVIVRSEPSSEGSIVGGLRPNERALYLGDAHRHFHIRLPDGREGYVSKSWTRREASVDPASATSLGKLELHFVDVGQGDSTLIVCPNGQRILVDLGSISRPNINVVREYLFEHLDQRERRIKTITI